MVVLALLAAVALAGYLASSVLGDVYSGVPASIAVSSIATSCRPATGNACDALVIRLTPGRFHIHAPSAVSSVTIAVQDPSAVSRARVLLLRTESPGQLAVGGDGAVSEPLVFDVPVAGVRSAIRLPARQPVWNRLTFTPAVSGKPLVIRELGFFESEDGLLRSTRQPFPWIPAQRFYATYVVLAMIAIYACVLAAAWSAPAVVHRIGPWVLAALCGSVCILELGTTFSPYWSHDLRSMYGLELVESGANGNLTGNLYEGARLLQGLGATEPPGIVQWHRMPGYGLFCGLAAAIGRTTDVVEIAMTVIILQVLLYSVSVGAFVAAAGRLFAPWMACLLGMLVTLLPKQLNYTQVDSIIAPIALVVAATLLIHLAATRGGARPPLRTFSLANAAFAFWFLMRNDVLPGWVVVSLMLAARRWRYVMVPLLLIVAVGVSWALYKQQYTHEFSPLPTNTGEVLFLSLCEVPGRFPFSCNDVGYFDWVRRISGADPTSRRASNRAVREVVQYWVTYPVHFGFMVISKFRRCVYDESWPGVHTRFNWLYTRGREAGLFLFLLTAVAVAIAVNHERRRSILLGWTLFFNMPLFFVAFESAGRFYSAASVGAVVAAVPLLFEPGFYEQIARQRRRAVVVLACIGALAIGGGWVESLVRSNDALHYWAPLLDPRASTLAFPSP